MSKIIRAATETDAPRLAAVHLASAMLAYANIFPLTASAPTIEDLTLEWVEMIADGNGAVFVARHDDEIVGAVALVPSREQPEDFFLARLYVHPDHWGLGYGAALHDHAVAVGHGRSATLKLWVLEQNTMARRMYERRGWQLVPHQYLANDPPEVRDVLYISTRHG